MARPAAPTNVRGKKGAAPPSVPTGLSAVSTYPFRIDLSWTTSTDGTYVTGYRIYRWTTGDPVRIGTSATTSYQDVGVSEGTTYNYAVSAYNSARKESGLSGTSSAAPTTLYAIVAWTAPATNSAGQTFDGSSNDRKIAKYRVYYAVDAIAPYTEPASIQAKTSAYVEVSGVASPYSPPATSKVLVNLTPGMWYFRVTAFDYASDGVSPGDESEVNTTAVSKLIT